MKIIIECEKCGNNHILSAKPKKYLQFRDNLEVGRFKYVESDTVIKNGKLESIMILCSCGNYITLGVD